MVSGRFGGNFCGGISRTGDPTAPIRSALPLCRRKNGAIITLARRRASSPFSRGASVETREDRNVRVGLRGVGEHSEGKNSISGFADDKVRVPHPVPESTEFRSVQSALAPICIGLGRIKLSLADALRRRPRRHHRPHRSIARDVAGLTKRSSMARSVGSALLLLYGLPLRRSLLLRSGFRLRLSLRCFLRHTALLAKLSWRCRISAYANRGHCISITTAR
jgi:hypothetical protein